jgi:rare lipoprotein A
MKDALRVLNPSLRKHNIARLALNAALAPLLWASIAGSGASAEEVQDGGDWRAIIVGQPSVRDPAWTTVVFARRAPVVETASLSKERGPGMSPLTGTSHALDGIASYYGQGEVTASGEAFDKRAMTAAHQTLPLGTLVKVTNLGNGRSAILRINDRGPFVAGRIIDVSEGAAEVLGMTARGLAAVHVELVQND